ncbi:MAG: M56 family metallopeptidase [Clostridia bacterium]|nr:M56 family metallopeptidase [Clostridia bacterium]
MTSFILGVFELTVGMSAFITLLLLTLKLFGKKFTAKCRYILWTLVIIRLAIPFSFGLMPSLIEIPIEPDLLQIEDASGTLAEDMDPLTQNSALSNPDGNTAGSDIQAVYPNVNPDHTPALPSKTDITPLPEEPAQNDTAAKPIAWNHILSITGIIYFAGAAVFLVWVLGAYFVYTGKLLKSAKDADNRPISIYRAVCNKYGIQRLPTLLVASDIHSPAAFGLFHRRIVLPDIEFTDNGLVGTLAHEVTHCKRGDLYVKFAALLARSLGWFNPLVHIAAMKCEMEMELSCDEAVLSGCSDEARSAYGEVMLDIIRRCRRNRGLLTTHFNPHKNAVAARIKNIIYGSGKRHGRILISVCLVLCVLAGTFVACQTDENIAEDHWYQEGYYLRCGNGSDMIIMDAAGVNPASPCVMTAADSSVSFNELTDGDRIRIEVFLIEETYPARADVYSVEKLSDGKIEDIDPAVLDSLRELGWIENSEGPAPEECSDCYFTSDIENFIPPNASSKPDITVLEGGKMLLEYETNNSFPLVYYAQVIDAESCIAVKTEFPDLSESTVTYDSAELIDIMYVDSNDLYVTLRYTKPDGAMEDVQLYGMPSSLTADETGKAHLEFEWQEIYRESANETNLNRGTYQPVESMQDENAKLLFGMKTKYAYYYFCSVGQYDFAVYYQDYVNPEFSMLNAPIPSEYKYDSAVPVYAYSGEGGYRVRFILKLTDGYNTYYLRYAAYENIPAIYHPVSDDEIKMLEGLFFEASRTDTITSLEDYTLLGPDFYESYYEYTRALLTGDTAKMEELSMYPAGTFDGYKGVHFTFKSITREAETGRFILTADVSEGHEVLPGGMQRFYYCEYPRRALEPILESSAPNATEASAELSKLLNMTMKYNLDEMEVTEYIIDCLYRKTGKASFTEGEIVGYAKRCFGVEAFTPNQHFMTDGAYTSLAHGGNHIYHDIIGTNYSSESGISTVTVRFYADYAKTVYSHLIEYQMKKLDGDFVFIGQKTIDERSLRPFTHAT